MRSKMKGGAFKRLRKKAGFKYRSELAEVLKCTVDCIRKWETNKRSIPQLVVDKLKELTPA
jgi:DNA-binding transcriptional regulator YiaG